MLPGPLSITVIGVQVKLFSVHDLAFELSCDVSNVLQ